MLSGRSNVRTGGDLMNWDVVTAVDMREAGLIMQ